MVFFTGTKQGRIAGENSDLSLYQQWLAKERLPSIFSCLTSLVGDPHALATQDIYKEIVDLRDIHTQKNKAELRVNIPRPYYLNNAKTISCVDKKHYLLPFVVLNSLMADPH